MKGWMTSPHVQDYSSHRRCQYQYTHLPSQSQDCPQCLLLPSDLNPGTEGTNMPVEQPACSSLLLQTKCSEGLKKFSSTIPSCGRPSTSPDKLRCNYREVKVTGSPFSLKWDFTLSSGLSTSILSSFCIKHLTVWNKYHFHLCPQYPLGLGQEFSICLPN